MDKRIVVGSILACVVLLVAGIWLSSNRSAPTPAADPTSEQALKNPQNVTEKEWFKGSATAPVTVVEYADFQCPACAAYSQVVARIASEIPDKVRFVYRHYPLTSIHDKAWSAAKAAEAAGIQGKFWEMHDKLFASQSDWSKQSQSQATSTFESFAKDLGLDTAKWKSDFNSEEVEKQVMADRDNGNKFNINGTPTFFVNDVLISLPGSYERLKQVIEQTAEKVQGN